jgi:hypothetical protein
MKKLLFCAAVVTLNAFFPILGTAQNVERCAPQKEQSQERLLTPDECLENARKSVTEIYKLMQDEGLRDSTLTWWAENVVAPFKCVETLNLETIGVGRMCGMCDALIEIDGTPASYEFFEKYHDAVEKCRADCRRVYAILAPRIAKIYSSDPS